MVKDIKEKEEQRKASNHNSSVGSASMPYPSTAEKRDGSANRFTSSDKTGTRNRS